MKFLNFIFLTAIIVVTTWLTYLWLGDISFCISCAWFAVILFTLLFKGFEISPMVEYSSVHTIIGALENKDLKQRLHGIAKTPKELFRIEDLKLFAEGNQRIIDSQNFSTDFEEQLLQWVQHSVFPLILTGILAFIQSKMTQTELSTSKEVILYIKTTAVILPIVYGVAHFYSIIIHLRKKNKNYVTSANNV